MSEKPAFFERMKAEAARLWDRFWPWPLVTAMGFTSLGAGLTYVFTPRLDYHEEIRKVALTRVMQDVRESKGLTAEESDSFQSLLAAYYAKRKQRDVVVLDASLSSLEKVTKVQRLESRLIEAEKSLYSHPLAKIANRRTLFLEYVINRSLAEAPANPDLAQAEAQQ